MTSSIEPSAKMLRQAAERFATEIAARSGESLDFSPASLAVLDSLIVEWRDLASIYAGPEGVDLSGLAQPLMAYFGEVLIRTLSGRWVDDPTGPYIALGGRLRIDVAELARAALDRPGAPELRVLYEGIERAGRGT